MFACRNLKKICIDWWWVGGRPSIEEKRRSGSSVSE